MDSSLLLQMTAQNEPTDGLKNNFPFNALGFTDENQVRPIRSKRSYSHSCGDRNCVCQRDFIKFDLGPALQQHFPSLNLMILDDQRTHVLQWSSTILSDPEAAKVTSRENKCIGSR